MYMLYMLAFMCKDMCAYSFSATKWRVASHGSKVPTPKRRRPLPSLKMRTRRLLSRPELIWAARGWAQKVGKVDGPRCLVCFLAVLKANIDLWTETNTKDKKASEILWLHCGYKPLSKQRKLCQSVLRSVFQ